MVVGAGTDSTTWKHVSFTQKDYNISSLRPIAYGTREDIVRHQMPDCQSYLRMMILRINAGKDHAPELKEHVVPYFTDMCFYHESHEVLSWKRTDGASQPTIKKEKIHKLVVPHMLLQAPPEELDEQFNIVKTHPIGTWRSPNRGDVRFGCYSDVEIEIEPVITGDNSMMQHLTVRRRPSRTCAVRACCLLRP
jgi:hypothetical protein